MTPAQSQVLEFGPFRICPRERLLRRANEVIPLPPKAVDTLLVLLSNAGRGVTKSELMDRVWPDAVVEEGGLARNISVIRKALGDLDGKTYIQTIPRRGYRFIAPVGSPALPVEAQQSLAVLPLDSVSAASGDDYFAEGMTEALITQLSRLDALRVCPRTTSTLYRLRTKPLREIARELQVELVVEGSVLHANGQVRITVRLVRAADEKPLWSGVYERLLQDVLRLQSDVARDIVRQFQLQLTGAEEAMLHSAREVNPAAYTHYLKGRYFLNQRTRDSLLQARESFLQSIAHQPNDAPSHAGLAHAYAMLGSAGYDVLPPHDAMPLARDAAIRALALDSASAEALAALGLIKMAYEWDFPTAERHLRMAATLEPHNSTPWRWLGELALARTDPLQAVPAFETAIALDPVSVPAHLGLGWSFYFLRRHPQAVGQFQRTLQLSPNLPMALYGLGLSLVHQRKELEGLQVFLQADLSTRGDAAAIMLLAAVHAFTGNQQEADRHLARLLDAATATYVPAVYFAYIYAIANDLDRAFTWLHRAVEERSSDLIFLRLQPALNNLRADPRFAALEQRIWGQP